MTARQNGSWSITATRYCGSPVSSAEFVLRPRGRYRIPSEVTITSPRGTTSIHLKWNCRELWRTPAANLLARHDPGLIPWVPLCQTRRSPASLLTECRRQIEQLAPQQDQEGLLATTYVYASLRYSNDAVLNVLGDRKVITETPLVKQFIEEGRVAQLADAILIVLESRFGKPSEELSAKLHSVTDLEQLTELLRLSAKCDDIKTIERELELQYNKL